LIVKNIKNLGSSALNDLMYNNLNVIKAIPEQEIIKTIEISATFREICCLSRGVSCK
jgi:hypothetical protein